MCHDVGENCGKDVRRFSSYVHETMYIKLGTEYPGKEDMVKYSLCVYSV